MAKIVTKAPGTVLPFSVQFNRGYKAPLDLHTTFETLALAEAYLTSYAEINVYDGLLISVGKNDDVKLYIVKSTVSGDNITYRLEETGGSVKKVSNKTAIDLFATADNIGKQFYLTTDITSGSGESLKVDYAKGLYVVTGASQYLKLATSSASGDLAGDVDRLETNITPVLISYGDTSIDKSEYLRILNYGNVILEIATGGARVKANVSNLSDTLTLSAVTDDNTLYTVVIAAKESNELHAATWTTSKFVSSDEIIIGGSGIDEVLTAATTVKEAISTLNTSISDLSEDLGDANGGLTKDVNDLKSKVSNLESLSGTSTLVTDVKLLKLDVGDQSGQIKDIEDALWNDADNLTGQVSALKTAVGDTSTGLVKKVNDLDSAAIKTVNVKTATGTSALTKASNAVTVDLSGYALKTDVTSVYKYKGSKTKYTDLPTSGQTTGDTYNVVEAFTLDSKYYPAGTNVVWDGSKWDPLGGILDLSEYYTKEEVDAIKVIVVSTAATSVSDEDWSRISASDSVKILDGVSLYPAIKLTVAGSILLTAFTPENKRLIIKIEGSTNSNYHAVIYQLEDYLDGTEIKLAGDVNINTSLTTTTTIRDAVSILNGYCDTLFAQLEWEEVN